jgi:hypothetical protein
VLHVCTVYTVLYSEIALSRKPFGIEHMYKYIFLFSMTDTMISQNIDLSSWDILYNSNTSEYAILPSCSPLYGYGGFGEACCFHIQSQNLNMAVACSSILRIFFSLTSRPAGRHLPPPPLRKISGTHFC